MQTDNDQVLFRRSKFWSKSRFCWVSHKRCATEQDHHAGGGGWGWEWRGWGGGGSGQGVCVKGLRSGCVKGREGVWRDPGWETTSTTFISKGSPLDPLGKRRKRSAPLSTNADDSASRQEQLESQRERTPNALQRFRQQKAAPLFSAFPLPK